MSDKDKKPYQVPAALFETGKSPYFGGFARLVMGVAFVGGFIGLLNEALTPKQPEPAAPPAKTEPSFKLNRPKAEKVKSPKELYIPSK